MASLVRRRYTATDPRTGKTVRKKARKWYGKYRDEGGKVRRVPLSANKAVAQQMLNKIVEKVERKKSGAYHPAEEHGRRPLAEHLEDYEAELLARGIPAGQVRVTAGRVRAVIEGCRFTSGRDVQAGAVLDFLAGLRRDRARPELPAGREWFTPAEAAALLGVCRRAVTALVRRQGLAASARGKGRARRLPRAAVEKLLDLSRRGLGSQTVSYYWREFKTFCRWMASPRQKRMAENPLADVAGPPPREEPRHDRRPLPEADLRRLLQAARASRWAWRGLSGEDRFHLYLTACVTGYRRGELAALTPERFDLDASPPVAGLPGRHTKNRNLAVQPLPPDAAEALRLYLRGRDPAAPVWGKGPLREIVVALRHDLQEAGIPYAVEGPEGPLFFDFHGLRHSYVLMLDRSGATVKEAMQLARHSDPRLTMARYGRAQLHDLGAAVERLPSLVHTPAPPPEREALKATGTEGNCLPGVSALAPPLAPAADVEGCTVMAADATSPSSGLSVSGSDDRGLSAVDGGRCQVTAGVGDGRNEETPGDRRLAFLYWGRVGAWGEIVRPGL